MSSVTFNNIVKRYGALTVIDDLNLSVDDGEFLVLLGPSGCGKTSLLHILAGLLPIEAGEIDIDDEDVTYLDPKDRGLAMVFQSYALYPTKTVRGNLQFGLSAQRLGKDEARLRVEEVAKLLQIEHLLDRKPAQLSGGQRQRVAIGRALVKQVSLVLFDEPLSNLDAKLRTEMRLEIKKLHNRLGNTVVYVTHDQVEAMTMATRIAVMNKGVIQQVGTPEEIYDTPANLFVADFVGSPGMNLVDAVLGSLNGETTANDQRNGLEFKLGGYKFRDRPEIGSSVRIGFRPEHLQPTELSEAAKDTLRLELPLQFVERVGSEAIAFMSLPGQTITARVEQRYLNRYRGAPAIPLQLPFDTLNVFDAQTGRRL